MIKIGITGGIGSGKTTVAELLSVMGISVYNSDQEGKRLMHEDVEVVQQVKQLFGDNAYRDGKLNNVYISKVVFQNQEILNRLNAIVHPVVILDFQRWSKRQNCSVVGVESAILFEAGIEEHLDSIIGVVAPSEIRINRVCSRSGLLKDEVLARINRQMSNEELRRRCDFIIENDDHQSIVKQLIFLLQQIDLNRNPVE